MDFVLMSCPYCGRAVDSSDQGMRTCESCGRNLYSDRSNIRAFIRPGELEDHFSFALDAIADGNEKRALEVADDLVESTEGNDFDSLFMRGYIYCRIGEDGKALIDWKKGLDILGDNPNIDAYICLMSMGVAEMILYKEREFVEFNPISYIDKLCEEFDESTDMSCKAFIYYSVYRNCLRIQGMKDIDDEYDEIIPELFKRIVAYHRSFRCLPRIIQEYLMYIGYAASTYDDDMNDVPHIYDLIGRTIAMRFSEIDEEERIRIFDYWNDKTLKENIEPMLDSLVKSKGLFSLRKTDSEEDRPAEIEAYVDKCLLRESVPVDDEDPDEPEETHLELPPMA